MDWRQHIDAVVRDAQANLQRVKVPLSDASASATVTTHSDLPSSTFARPSTSTAAFAAPGQTPVSADLTLHRLASTVQELYVDRAQQQQQIDSLREQVQSLNKRLEAATAALMAVQQQQHSPQHLTLQQNVSDRLAALEQASRVESDRAQQSAKAAVAVTSEMQAMRLAARAEMQRLEHEVASARTAAVQMQSEVTACTAMTRLVHQQQTDAMASIQTLEARQREMASALAEQSASQADIMQGVQLVKNMVDTLSEQTDVQLCKVWSELSQLLTSAEGRQPQPQQQGKPGRQARERETRVRQLDESALSLPAWEDVCRDAEVRIGLDTTQPEPEEDAGEDASLSIASSLPPHDLSTVENQSNVSSNTTQSNF
eukprot:m.13651 g.13651  ORF g.13651 m.13651 type:complete len:372 (-) comp6929_c0_seq1:90-1205(-)